MTLMRFSKYMMVSHLIILSYQASNVKSGTHNNKDNYTILSGLTESAVKAEIEKGMVIFISEYDKKGSKKITEFFNQQNIQNIVLDVDKNPKARLILRRDYNVHSEPAVLFFGKVGSSIKNLNKILDEYNIAKQYTVKRIEEIISSNEIVVLYEEGKEYEAAKTYIKNRDLDLFDINFSEHPSARVYCKQIQCSVVTIFYDGQWVGGLRALKTKLNEKVDSSGTVDPFETKPAKIYPPHYDKYLHRKELQTPAYIELYKIVHDNDQVLITSEKDDNTRINAIQAFLTKKKIPYEVKKYNTTDPEWKAIKFAISYTPLFVYKGRPIGGLHRMKNNVPILKR